MLRQIALATTLFALAGCDQAAKVLDSNTAAGFKSIKIEKDLSSPDNALKTWWRSLDAVEELGNKECKAYVKQRAESNYYQQISTGQVLNYLVTDDSACKLTIVEREIVEVKQETDTRAVAIARIKNATPTDIKPTDEQKEKRRVGSLYKYLLEKEGGEWKVSKVYETKPTFLRESADDVWSDLYKKLEGTYPDTVWHFQ